MRSRVPGAALCIALALPAPCLADGDTEEEPLYQLGALYIGDALANLHGGLREGSAWIDYLELAAAFDAGRALGVDDLTLFASVIRTNPPTFSERYVGDAMLVSNIDSEYALRVFEAWFDWGFTARGAGSVRVGLYDLNSEFDTTESRGLFINSAYGIGQELSQTGRNGPSIFPVSALAARLAWTPADPWLIEFAVVDGVPGDPGGTHRSRWHLSRSEGALLIGEITAAAGPVAQLSLGHWRYTEEFAGVGPVVPDDGTVTCSNATSRPAQWWPGPGRVRTAARWDWRPPRPGSVRTIGRCSAAPAAISRAVNATWNSPGASPSGSTWCCNRTCSTS